MMIINLQFPFFLIHSGICGVSKGPPIDDPNRSTVEVLPSDNNIQNPRDFYASDSPVMDDLNSDQDAYKSADDFGGGDDPEVQVGHQVGSSSAGPSVRFSYIYLAYATHC